MSEVLTEYFDARLLPVVELLERLGCVNDVPFLVSLLTSELFVKAFEEKSNVNLAHVPGSEGDRILGILRLMNVDNPELELDSSITVLEGKLKTEKETEKNKTKATEVLA